jgi:hypothetical protein
MFKIFIMMLVFVEVVFAKGGAGKCVTCPTCMICDPLIGCIYDNFTPCIVGVNNTKGYCVNGGCNTTIGAFVNLPKPPICKTYKFTRTIINGTSKMSVSLASDLNGLSCTKVGAILESVCIKGTCTPYVIAIDLTGNPTGCNGLPNGFLCDTNMLFTDGEKCINQKCVMPTESNVLCPL